MIADQTGHLAHGFIIKLQSSQDFSGNLFANQGMSFKMIHALLIGSLHRRLAHIVEQDRKPQHLICTYIFQRLQRMPVHIENMMADVLMHFHHGIPLRKDYLCNSQLTGIIDQLRMI